EKQSIVDWMAEAVIRGLPALQALGGSPDTNTVRTNPLAALREHCLPWIEQQLNYHSGNADMLARMNNAFERLTFILSIGVIAIVCFDIALLLLEDLEYASGGVQNAHWLPGALL